MNEKCGSKQIKFERTWMSEPGRFTLRKLVLARKRQKQKYFLERVSKCPQRLLFRYEALMIRQREKLFYLFMEIFFKLEGHGDGEATLLLLQPNQKCFNFCGRGSFPGFCVNNQVFTL